MLARSDAEGNVVLAGRALKAGIRNLKLAEGARAQGFWVVICLDWLSCNGLDLSLEGSWNLLSVFGSHQDASPVKSGLFEISFGALSYTGCKDVNAILRELRDVCSNSHEHASSSQMVIQFDEPLGKSE